MSNVQRNNPFTNTLCAHIKGNFFDIKIIIFNYLLSKVNH